MPPLNKLQFKMTNLIKFSTKSKIPVLLVHTRNSSKWIPPVGKTTDIKVYNCVQEQKVPFQLGNTEYITWYTCGPTVYDSSHLGHACCYVKLDIIQRTLKQYFNFNVVTVMNITDIDDKIVKRSEELCIAPVELAKKYEAEFWSDMRCLGVEMPNIVSRVTERMPQIINFVQKLLKNNKAYATKDGSVYFDLSNYKNYNKLVKCTKDSITMEKVDLEKRSAEDFALWKAAKPGEPSWETCWGDGRPGWHVECSAMASEVFGKQIDIHAGGIDLRFPHHENEEAQSCAFHNSNQWVNYWIHTGHLHLKGSEKMSKSFGNTITIQEFLKMFTSSELRMACLISHYKNRMEFSTDLMKTAKAILYKFHTFLGNCDKFVGGIYVCSEQNRTILETKLKSTNSTIHIALCDDFDTPKVMYALLELTTVTNHAVAAQTSKIVDNIHTNLDIVLAVRNFVVKILHIFGVNFEMPLETGTDAARFVNILDVVTSFRQGVRQIAMTDKNKELFKLCDELRLNLATQRIEIKDDKTESVWTDFKKN